MKHNLVIPCSGPGSRSSSYSKFHKALIQVGGCAVIDHIIHAFPTAETVYVLLGHNREYIEQYLKHAQYENVECINIPNWEESQISSLQQIPDYVFDMPFYLNSCDNWSPNIPSATENTVYLCRPENMSYYDAVSDSAFAGIGFVAEPDLFYRELHKISATRNDYLVYNQLPTLNEVMLDEWYDVGNAESYELTRENFPEKFDLLDKHHQEIYYTNNRIVKLFNKPVDNIKESIETSKSFPHPSPVLYTEKGLSYDFVEGESNAVGENYRKVLDNLSRLWTYCIQNNTSVDSTKIWKHKTQERFDMMIRKYPEFGKPIVINGTEIDPIRTIETLDWAMLNSGIYGPCHGDLILENIIVTDNGIQYIDHREGIVEDIFYDICKFYHNLHLNNINMKQFSLNIDDNKYIVDIPYFNQKRVLSFCETEIYKTYKRKIELGVGCIWLSMAPLNVSDELNKFLFLYAINHMNGVKNGNG